MANLDTRNKRASSVGVLKPYALDLPLPDGAVTQADRQQTVWDYSGILASGGGGGSGKPWMYYAAQIAQMGGG